MILLSTISKYCCTFHRDWLKELILIDILMIEQDWRYQNKKFQILLWRLALFWVLVNYRLRILLHLMFLKMKYLSDFMIIVWVVVLFPICLFITIYYINCEQSIDLEISYLLLNYIQWTRVYNTFHLNFLLNLSV